ncbi:M15 family metallopeptidase [Candidatus Sumerlaeota bacterium]|nr:M15 family metallopeptidase [Candidatus Sumerlaeota bacterium]
MRQKWIAKVLIVYLVPTIVTAHTMVASFGSEVLRVTTIAPKLQAVEPVFRVPRDTEIGNLWICWYDGAPINTLPLPTPRAVAQTARAGQTFVAEAVELTPLGTEWIRVGSPREGESLYVPLAYCVRVAPENTVRDDLPIGQENLDSYNGLPPHYRPSDLARLPNRYCYNDMPQYLRAEAAAACMRMLDAARAEARLHIKALSAFRSAQTQAYLCRQKIASSGIWQREVARPGHSEHQLGTTVDLVGANGLYLLDEAFDSTREGRWLRANCHRFGFVQTYYPRGARLNGDTFEPWHFRYVRRENVERFVSTLDLGPSTLDF